ncbi:MAG: DUF2635 domain-containing protein [Candidatus Omnitrophica bacterium]|jgi:hypothetical protein|nr:DUF2635 domain-containing protein [Candidatus Omnitrophota bacterium]
MQEFLKPKEGLLIRDPTTKIILSPEGSLMEMTNFWNRRVLDGTVEIVKSVQKKIVTNIVAKKEDDK